MVENAELELAPEYLNGGLHLPCENTQRPQESSLEGGSGRGGVMGGWGYAAQTGIIFGPPRGPSLGGHGKTQPHPLIHYRPIFFFFFFYGT